MLELMLPQYRPQSLVKVRRSCQSARERDSWPAMLDWDHEAGYELAYDVGNGMLCATQ